MLDPWSLGSRGLPGSKHVKMKIAIIVPRFPPKWLAGTELATLHIAECLAQRGHQIHVVTSWDDGLLEESTDNGLHIYRIKWRNERFLGPALFGLRTLLALRKINPDLIHCQDINMGFIGVCASKFLGKPSLVWGRGADVYKSGQVSRLISRVVLKKTNTVIALTENMRLEINRRCKRDVVVIPNGINLSDYEGLSKERTRTKLSLGEGEKVVLFVGTLRPVKGAEYLIRAFDIVRRNESGFKLLMVGDGEQREFLENLVKELDLYDIVTFVGKVPNEKVPQYLKASDVFVLPSLSEGFPNVVLEAMASGLPVVATRVGGMSEIIKDHINGYLVDAGDPDGIAEKLQLLLEDEKLSEQISTNNLSTVKDYSWNSVVDRIEMLYGAMLQ